MKKQILGRLGVAHVRDAMMQFTTGEITDGTVSLVLNKPIAGTVPQVAFTNNPAVKRS